MIFFTYYFGDYWRQFHTIFYTLNGSEAVVPRKTGNTLAPYSVQRLISVLCSPFFRFPTFFSADTALQNALFLRIASERNPLTLLPRLLLLTKVGIACSSRYFWHDFPEVGFDTKCYLINAAAAANDAFVKGRDLSAREFTFHRKRFCYSTFCKCLIAQCCKQEKIWWQCRIWF